MQGIADALGVGVGAAMVIGVLVLLQLTIQVFALVDVVRRPIVTGGSKLLWLLVILLGGVLGTIIYLALGRGTSIVTEQPEEARERSAEAGGRAERAADLLYGRQGQGEE